MKRKKFSIIVVSLNTKTDFLKTLESIKKQIYRNYEIIVIDGNSTDGTKKEIIKRKKTISKFTIEKDRGIYHAMNKGIKMSSGKWIIFMNSGDLFYKKDTLHNFLSKQLALRLLISKYGSDVFLTGVNWSGSKIITICFPLNNVFESVS